MSSNFVPIHGFMGTIQAIDISFDSYPFYLVWNWKKYDNDLLILRDYHHKWMSSSVSCWFNGSLSFLCIGILFHWNITRIMVEWIRRDNEMVVDSCALESNDKQSQEKHDVKRDRYQLANDKFSLTVKSILPWYVNISSKFIIVPA